MIIQHIIISRISMNPSRSFQCILFNCRMLIETSTKVSISVLFVLVSSLSSTHINTEGRFLKNKRKV